MLTLRFRSKTRFVAEQIWNLIKCSSQGKAWIPHRELFSLAIKHKEKLTDLLQQSGLSVLGTQFYPTQRAQREPSIPPGFKGLEVSA